MSDNVILFSIHNTLAFNNPTFVRHIGILTRYRYMYSYSYNIDLDIYRYM